MSDVADRAGALAQVGGIGYVGFMSSNGPPANRGLFPTEQEALAAVVARLIQRLQPREVYLFGSRAEGRARPWSDFDIAVVLDDELPEELTSYEHVYAPVLGMGIGCDVVPYRTSELREVLGDPANPWHATLKKAKKLYEHP